MKFPGSLDKESQWAFVKEIERVGRDTAYFYVRREASLALGALAKVVADELVAYSLVRGSLLCWLTLAKVTLLAPSLRCPSLGSRFSCSPVGTLRSPCDSSSSDSQPSAYSGIGDCNGSIQG